MSVGVEKAVAVQQDISALVGRLTNLRLIGVLALLFALPAAIFAPTLSAPLAIAVVAGAVVTLAIVWTLRPATGSLLAAQIDFTLYASCALLALVMCLLGGEGHFFYANTDWLMRDGVLSDLVQHGFVVGYRHEGVDYFLRAPLGMYMIPAAVGRGFGLVAAHMTLLAQNTLALSVILYFLASVASGRKALVLLLFVAFSGVEILFAGLAFVTEYLRSGQFIPLLEIDAWNETIDYTSNVTLLFNAPNHTLPGWAFAMLALLYVRREVDLAALLAFCAVFLFWSPLAMMGAAPFMLLFVAERVTGLFASRSLVAIAGGLCFLPLALYMQRDSGSVPHGLLVTQAGFLGLYALFLFLELPHVPVVIYGWRHFDVRDRRIVALAIALLLAIPCYKIGFFNDFGSRASAPALFLLSFAFANILTAQGLPANLRRAGVAIALIAAATPALEVSRSFLHGFVISDCNLLTASIKTQPVAFPTNYLARIEAFPDWLAPVGETRLENEKRMCWPDHPLIGDDRK